MKHSIIDNHITHDSHDMSTKETILKVTIDLIKREGFEAVTIRKIASLANVNAALINYHFGSKDRLLNEVLKVFVNHMKDCFSILDNHDLPAKERLTLFLIEYAKSFQTHPELFKRILAISSIPFDSHNEYASFMRNMGLHKVLNTVQEITGECDRQKLILFTIQLVGATALPAILTSTFEQYDNEKMRLPNVTTQVKALMEHYF